MSQTLNSAIEYHRQGKLDKAELIYRQILADVQTRCDAIGLAIAKTYLRF